MPVSTRPQPTQPQVPEQNETYEEDCFVVHGGEVESETKEEEGPGESKPEESFVCRRMTKRPRTIPVDDSSEEEEIKRRKKGNAGDPALPCRPAQTAPFRPPRTSPPPALGGPLWGTGVQRRCPWRRGADRGSVLRSPCLKLWSCRCPSPHGLSQHSHSPMTSTLILIRLRTGRSSTPWRACPRLSPTRCACWWTAASAAGPEVVSCLRAQTGVAVQLCPLGVTRFVVSGRMAVERLTQAEAEEGGGQNREALRARVLRLLGLYDRVCLILEKQHARAGDVSLSALIRAGVRLLFSGGPQETAALVADLARSEQRKGHAIAVPAEVEGHRAGPELLPRPALRQLRHRPPHVPRLPLGGAPGQQFNRDPDEWSLCESLTGRGDLPLPSPHLQYQYAA
ncbi:hypothetical protein ANANG_G00020140 [Anguilla anguilla]|uniref:FANCM protein n=1 Tax=Anguilla anguilla TaxID=7936 RepID=A0A9D3S7B5_ANGAN|nr:hypothetical protein ANANG_G00020140 [Anguilla anguilla]